MKKGKTYYKFNYSKEVKSTLEQPKLGWYYHLQKKKLYKKTLGFPFKSKNIAINECKIKQKSKQTKNPMGSITRRMLQFYMKI